MRELKYVKLPDNHGLDEQHLKFLEQVDSAFAQSIDPLREELNQIYIDRERNTRPIREQKDFTATGEWIRAFFKKDLELLRRIEQKTWPSHVLHTGGNVNLDAGSQEQGAVLVPELLNQEISRIIQLNGIAQRDMRNYPFSGPGNTRRFPVETTGVTVGWVTEGETKPKTKPTIGSVLQELKKIAAMVIITDDLLEDNIADLISYLTAIIGEAIASEEDRTYLSGRITSGDVFDGVLYAPGTVAVNMAVGDGASDITPETLLAMTLAIPSGSVSGSSFYMNRETFAHIQAYRADSINAGDRAGSFLITQDPSGRPITSLWGFPVVLSDALPGATSVTGNLTPFAFFGNLGRTCIYGSKNETRVKLLDQATVTDSTGTLVNLAERDMSCLRVYRRTSYVPILPGGLAILRTGARS